MRLLLTADWHLGRLFLGRHLTDDQAYVLDQLVDLVTEARIDVVVLAGDVYDRAVPPPEAVALLGDVAQRVVVGAGVPMAVIAGNHDSPERLGFASGMLRQSDLHITGPLADSVDPVVLVDEHGPVSICPLTYAEPAVARAVFADPSLHDHAAVIARALGACPASGGRRVVVAHAFVTGGEESESERPLTLGGAACVPADLFAGVDLVALGHLHRPQQLAATRLGTTDHAQARIQYSGSLLKYSFDECAQTKSVTVAEIGAPGSGPDGLASLHCERIPLTPRHDLRRVQGLLKEILAAATEDPRANDYIEAVLQDRGALYDAMGQIRTVYPNALSLRTPQVELSSEGRRERPDPAGSSDAELFAAFVEHVTGEAPSDAERALFASAADQVRQRDREAAP